MRDLADDLPQIFRFSNATCLHRLTFRLPRAGVVFFFPRFDAFMRASSAPTPMQQFFRPLALQPAAQPAAQPADFVTATSFQASFK
jgi:hypothetical protein